MLGLAGKFARSRGGSMMPLFFISLVPLVTVVGFSVDYTSAVQTRSNMQQALDAATLAITTLPKTTALAARQQMLRDTFAANGGQGTATLVSFTIAANGTATAQASASFAMPTDFMQIARINTVPVGVTSAVNKAPALVQTTFKIEKASGWWDKTMYLYGTRFGSTTKQKLMQISYVYNKGGDPKGYGTTTVSTVSGTTLTQVQQQVCNTTTVANFNNTPSGAITSTDGNGVMRQTVCTTTPANSTGAVIDVSQMDQLYLEMDVPSAATAKPAQPTTLRSNDPNTSNRLYIGTSPTDMPEIATGQTVDIFTAVPCGQTGYQAWEDGGSAVPAPVVNADFFYTVMGKCDFNQRPSQTVLTQ
ncbi:MULTISPECIES: TadE/TadG family type IV pilus assembly protein [unclassified Mesorhizobium]|uniref:TadE/TadG family type IV pilus assembly protein n=1 Tax=unclassified Mesorhizobium TaxID=325217 RepID=UPI0011280DBB|nr:MULTISPECIES: TadE/TadG family type IV pilus assembly protein [unclassified Mesorhizobium]MCA0055233.1 pilus assembly protein [Mesorhizobium sp. B261B1A]TPL13317.1 pilus assembly protein [Mesorhizobium sp. B2-4-11]